MGWEDGGSNLRCDMAGPASMIRCSPTLADSLRWQEVGQFEPAMRQLPAGVRCWSCFLLDFVLGDVRGTGDALEAADPARRLEGEGEDGERGGRRR